MDVQTSLEALGNLTESDPLIRGATVAGVALAAVLGVAWRVTRVRKPAPRAVVRVDAPPDQPVEVRVGKQ